MPGVEAFDLGALRPRIKQSATVALRKKYGSDTFTNWCFRREEIFVEKPEAPQIIPVAVGVRYQAVLGGSGPKNKNIAAVVDIDLLTGKTLGSEIVTA